MGYPRRPTPPASSVLMLALSATVGAGCFKSHDVGPRDGGATRDGALARDAGRDASRPTDAGRSPDAGPFCPAVIGEGTPCNTPSLSCGAACTDACTPCNLYFCDPGLGVWVHLEAPPAPCFSCGPELRCRLDIEYCEVYSSDVPGEPSTYDCRLAPRGCAPAQCECLPSGGGLVCTEDGGVTLRYLGG